MEEIMGIEMLDPIREQVEEILSECKTVFVRKGNGWRAFYDGVDVDFELGEAGVLRAKVSTGVMVSEDRKAAVNAYLNYVCGWVLKVGSAMIADDSEVTLYLDRKVSDGFKPDVMARVMGGFYDDHVENLREVASGASVTDVLGNKKRDFRALLSALS